MQNLVLHKLLVVIRRAHNLFQKRIMLWCSTFSNRKSRYCWISCCYPTLVELLHPNPCLVNAKKVPYKLTEVNSAFSFEEESQFVSIILIFSINNIHV
mmetsp:Transcript_15783/g.23976  ORF Transcript_15783/g.23976 Transcript_15783/m.23976 type:complete len:98 (+) Transcript_15783:93-386(+)